MIFKMMMDASSEDEKPVVRGFLKHLILGFAGGVAVGSVLLGGMLLSLQNMDLDMPLLWIFAMMLQCGPVGGLIGVGVWATRTGPSLSVAGSGSDASSSLPASTSFLRRAATRASRAACAELLPLNRPDSLDLPAPPACGESSRRRFRRAMIREIRNDTYPATRKATSSMERISGANRL